MNHNQTRFHAPAVQAEEGRHLGHRVLKISAAPPTPAAQIDGLFERISQNVINSSRSKLKQAAIAAFLESAIGGLKNGPESQAATCLRVKSRCNAQYSLTLGELAALCRSAFDPCSRPQPRGARRLASDLDRLGVAIKPGLLPIALLLAGFQGTLYGGDWIFKAVLRGENVDPAIRAALHRKAVKAWYRRRSLADR